MENRRKRVEIMKFHYITISRYCIIIMIDNVVLISTRHMFNSIKSFDNNFIL